MLSIITNPSCPVLTFLLKSILQPLGSLYNPLGFKEMKSVQPIFLHLSLVALLFYVAGL